MEKVINGDALRDALQVRGWTQKDLATELGVTAQAVTNWLKGADFPRPPKLLQLATKLQLQFSDLVLTPNQEEPVVAFRKRGNSKTTQDHILHAMAIGAMLKPLVPYLDKQSSLRTQFVAPSTQYEPLQAMAAQVRGLIGLGEGAVLRYDQLIQQFSSNGAVIVPVMWGEKHEHKNALHILLKQEKVTFIFLNLDTYLEDFKFWMAHELAHVYTPELAGTNEGEDFADAFAGALLFPKAVAKEAYAKSSQQALPKGEIKVLQTYASEHSISLYSVYCEVNRYAHANGLPPVRCVERDIHAIRNKTRGQLVSNILFEPLPPKAEVFIAAAESGFGSEFFPALRRMLRANGTGPSYVQQVMDIPLQDAVGLHEVLTR
jgi:transcriptional regulator with XRE-family HTH domain/Zn-dependent peptidase ImmA (M78 family)